MTTEQWQDYCEERAMQWRAYCLERSEAWQEFHEKQMANARSMHGILFASGIVIGVLCGLIIALFLWAIKD